jgi:hypothetical protein
VQTLQISHNYTIEPYGRPVGRTEVLQLEKAISELPESLSPEEAEEQLNTHLFAPGVYARTILIPQDMCVVGKIHKHAHVNIITYGMVKVITEFGEDILEGPCTWVSEPGTKRAVYAMEDTQWITIHPNPSNTEDIKAIEDEVVAESYEELDKLLLEELI